jgi:predicted amidohydrolase
MGKLQISLAQINTKLGDPPANLEKHLSLIKDAHGSDLIVFPELSLTGYALQDLAPTMAMQPDKDSPIFSPMYEASKRIDILVGFVEADHRHRVYISAAYLSAGELLHVHRKVYLPTYGLFDEGRFFTQGDQVRAFDTRFGRIGVLICEDFWHASPPYLLWLDGAELMLFVSASPGKGLSSEPVLESAKWVERINQAYASLFTTFVAHTNRVGFEDGLNFWGGATVYDPNGVNIAHGPYHEEALIEAELDLTQLQRTRTRLPLLRDERKSLVHQELARIIAQG